MEISKSQVLSFSGISGAALLYSYYFFLKGKSRKIIEKYWGSITGNTRFVYKISMILCVISMISIIYKINKTSKKNYNNEFLGLSMLILSLPSTSPMPVIAPIKQWVVETLRPNCVAVSTVSAVPTWAAYPREKVNLAILSPIVSITLCPYVASPSTVSYKSKGYHRQMEVKVATLVKLITYTNAAT